MPAAPLSGPAYLLRGLRLINQPGLRRFAVLPVCIALVIFVVLAWAAYAYFGVLLDRLLPSGEGWWATGLRAILWPLFFLAVVLVWYFGFTVTANLVAAPFNGLLAEKVEARLTGAAPAATNWRALLADLLPAMFNELRKLAYYLLWAVPLLILFLVPVINLAAPVLWGLFAAWMHYLEYLEYPMENHGIRFRAVRRRARRLKLGGLGFGAAVMFATLVPVLNLVVMPAPATALWVERLKDEGEVR